MVADSDAALLRAGLWNIKRGLNYDLIESALTSRSDFEHAATGFDRNSGAQKVLIESQLATLQRVDVLVLNEVDLGMKRTGYRDVARDLADALHMNYVSGVEFGEVDPLFDVGTEKVHLPSPSEDARRRQRTLPRSPRHGYPEPLSNRERAHLSLAVLLRLVCTRSEANLSARKGQALAARTVFGERVEREVRQGAEWP